jgi:methionyl-tRNA synthetase
MTDSSLQARKAILQARIDAFVSARVSALKQELPNLSDRLTANQCQRYVSGKLPEYLAEHMANQRLITIARRDAREAYASALDQIALAEKFQAAN